MKINDPATSAILAIAAKAVTGADSDFNGRCGRAVSQGETGSHRFAQRQCATDSPIRSHSSESLMHGMNVDAPVSATVVDSLPKGEGAEVEAGAVRVSVTSNETDYKIDPDFGARRPLTKRILVVDDDMALRNLVRQLLVARSYEVFTADSGAVAVRACRQDRFDLILMDVQMPRMDGMETARTIREVCGLNACTPIMAVTSYLSMDNLAQLRASGMDDYVPKPIKFDIFFARIAHWCA